MGDPARGSIDGHGGRRRPTSSGRTRRRSEAARLSDEAQTSCAPVGDRPMTNEHGRHREVSGSEERGHTASVGTVQRAQM